MIWLQQGNRRYLYTSNWRNGRAVKTYLGTGIVAAAAAAEILVQREEKRRQREAQQAAERQYQRALRLAKSYSEKVDLLLAAELTVAGYHRPHYRPWRKKRV